MHDLTGPISDELIGELEALKLSLFELSARDLDPVSASALGLEISAIRLQLKRLAAEQAFPLQPEV
jgi:hypothetical protein